MRIYLNNAEQRQIKSQELKKDRKLILKLDGNMRQNTALVVHFQGRDVENVFIIFLAPVFPTHILSSIGATFHNMHDALFAMAQRQCLGLWCERTRVRTPPLTQIHLVSAPTFRGSNNIGLIAVGHLP